MTVKEDFKITDFEFILNCVRLETKIRKIETAAEHWKATTKLIALENSRSEYHKDYLGVFDKFTEQLREKLNNKQI